MDGSAGVAFSFSSITFHLRENFCVSSALRPNRRVPPRSCCSTNEDVRALPGAKPDSMAENPAAKVASPASVCTAKRQKTEDGCILRVRPCSHCSPESGFCPIRIDKNQISFCENSGKPHEIQLFQAGSKPHEEVVFHRIQIRYNETSVRTHLSVWSGISGPVASR